jgi:DNA topoisomerase-1
MKILIIVESPTKAKKIQAFLGNDYIVKSSFGHIRDLNKETNNIGVNVENNFKPDYIITKTKQVSELKAAQKCCGEVILASDLDREGEAIAWHLAEVLKLNNPKRIVFNSISKKAILEAIKNPRKIDMDMVNAQQARRILDRLVGFELSPLLWKHIANAMSAGRVQSVTTRLIMDRESEIEKFSSETYYKTSSIFHNGLEGDLDKNFKQCEEANDFLNHCITAELNISDIQQKTVKRFPSAPFRTSTMQQEAGRKLNMSAKIIMSHAQTLYENGYITYHRTDCVDISPEGMTSIKEYILEKYGEEYLNVRKYKTKAKDAQEAHECIRPININKENLDDTDLSVQQKKLYEIIWKKTVSSQMSPCEVEVYTVEIDVSKRVEKFICKAEKIVFPGYKIIYDYKDVDQDADEKDSLKKMDRNLKIIDSLKNGQEMKYKTITSTEKFTKASPRYTEATLTKKMEDLGIGRPATTASIITTIQDRNYIVKETRKGTKVPYKIYTLEKDTIVEKDGETVMETEKNKLFPTELGKEVTKFLIENFPNILEYEFTSKIERELDEVAKGKQIWENVVKNVYENYHPNVVKLNSVESKVIKKDVNKRLVGKENETGKNIYAYNGKFGPVLQIGESGNKTDVKFVPIKEEYSVDTITETVANSLLKYPKNLGKIDGKDLCLKEGKFGIYLSYNGKNYSIKDGIDPANITLEQATDMVKERDDKIVKVFNQTTKIMNGPYGPFIVHGKKIAPVPKTVEDPSKLTLNDCKEFVKMYKPKPKTIQ